MDDTSPEVEKIWLELSEMLERELRLRVASR
jgi:hypothetical protein